MTKLLITLTFLFALVFAPSEFAAAQRPETDNPPVIVVTGEAEVRVEPDEATVRIGVVRQANTAQLAQDQANTAASEILAALGKAGILPKDIQTSRLTLNPVYAPRSPEASQAPRIVAYQASNVVSVHLIDLNKVGPAIDAGLKSGSNEIQGVQFGIRDDLPVRQQALKQAVAAAQKKAEAIAEAAHVQLMLPLEISENGVSVMPKGGVGGEVYSMARAMAPTPVSAGELEVRANVTIRYRIRP